MRTEHEPTLAEMLEGLPADHGARKELSRLRRAVHILEIIRDADEDCKKDGLPRPVPERIRLMIDVAIDAAPPPVDEEIVLHSIAAVVSEGTRCPDCNGHGTATSSRGFHQTSCRTCWGTGRQVIA
ncbi:hypothetical protein [uncultured Hyphomicrobium sp.]|uniref:hypothetical protein n=1 Tax=uncultured Hyphomicrobium sp. TaxID=194373 RepID=UPI0025FDB87C|nr:hypothetical protein [uncultured Hyphomicrobium sp.]